jgi:hypothetical protein
LGDWATTSSDNAFQVLMHALSCQRLIASPPDLAVHLDCTVCGAHAVNERLECCNQFIDIWF